jgi:asparagine synthase (glutamine-hydrolysing)
VCRITGILSFDGKLVDKHDLILMRDTMIAGGPDDAGLWLDQNHRIGFGHRRLSILDLSSAGHQPMHTPDGRFTICYNGEIYNFRSIRSELEQQGISFKSDCDTEVLLHAFANEGLACLNRLHGMFAIAIWDAHEKVLTLTRDRIGVKPLYYALQGGSFLFGSELKSIMAHPRFERRLSTKALQLFLEYSYVPHPHSILEDAFKLGPGQWLQVNDKGRVEVGTWWSASENLVTDFDWADHVAVERELEARMTRSFERRMVADVPVGVFLSGGIDSSLLLALLKERIGGDIKTFTIGFDESEYNEAHYAKKVAKALGSDHHELYLQPERGLEIIEQLPTIWDEPFGDNSAIATYLVSEFAVKHVKVALSADGGDELFCGYPKYWLTMERVAAMRRHPFVCRTLAASPSILLEGIGRKYSGNKLLKIKDLMSADGSLERNAFVYGQHVFSNYQLERLMAISGHSDWLPQMALWDRFPSADPLAKMMAIDLSSYHTDDIHVKVDRASMANSLEAREPFLDHEIVEFALGIPGSMKLPNHDQAKSKQILRNVLYKHIDKTLIERPKMGFGVPLDHWLNNQLKGLVDNLLRPEKLANDGLFNPAYVAKIRQSFARNPKQELNKIWNLVVFQMWKERWL